MTFKNTGARVGRIEANRFGRTADSKMAPEWPSTRYRNEAARAWPRGCVHATRGTRGRRGKENEGGTTKKVFLLHVFVVTTEMIDPLDGVRRKV